MVQQVRVSIIPRPSTLDEVQCMCVFIPFILDIKFVGRTSRGHTGGRSHRISQNVSGTTAEHHGISSVHSEKSIFLIHS